MLIEGIFAAVPTPFYPDERVYFRKLEANMARYSRGLLSGMVVLGSTGEAVMLDDAESRDVLRIAAESTAPEKVLIAGVGRESGGGVPLRCDSGANPHLLWAPDEFGSRSALLPKRSRSVALAGAALQHSQVRSLSDARRAGV
jgi:hypothetical protein